MSLFHRRIEAYTAVMAALVPVCGSSEAIVRVCEGRCAQLGYALCIAQFL
jgi:hypothetical protein